MTIANCGSVLLSGGRFLQRTADTIGNLRITWLAIGLLTSWGLGLNRARHLQIYREQETGELNDRIHTPEECASGQCAGGATGLAAGRDEYIDPCFELNCSEPLSDFGIADHFEPPGQNQLFHRVTHHPERPSKVAVKHTPSDCVEAGCAHNHSDDTYEEEDLCIPCKEDHFAADDDKYYHHVKHTTASSDPPLPAWRLFFPLSAENAKALGAYTFLSMTFAWSVGRLPLSISSLRYGMGLAIIKFVDSVVIAHWVIGDTDVKDYKSAGPATLYKLFSSGWTRPSAKLITMTLFYFGLRLADGCLMARMPAYQLPFASLIGKMRLLGG
jgi:hypothetical protein